jgi:hypothetical protein
MRRFLFALAVSAALAGIAWGFWGVTPTRYGKLTNSKIHSSVRINPRSDLFGQDVVFHFQGFLDSSEVVTVVPFYLRRWQAGDTSSFQPSWTQVVALGGTFKVMVYGPSVGDTLWTAVSANPDSVLSSVIYPGKLDSLRLRAVGATGRYEGLAY